MTNVGMRYVEVMHERHVQMEMQIEGARRERQGAQHETDHKAAEKDHRPVHVRSFGINVSDNRSTSPGMASISPSNNRQLRESGCAASRSRATPSNRSCPSRAAPSRSH